MSAFTIAIADFAKKAEGNADLVVRKVAREVLKRVVMKSPVDTGRFRANWNVGIEKVGVTTKSVDPTGGETILRGSAEIQAGVPGQSIWISNALPYARRLEYGYSKQTPAGMVRITLAEFSGILGAAVKGLP